MQATCQLSWHSSMVGVHTLSGAPRIKRLESWRSSLSLSSQSVLVECRPIACTKFRAARSQAFTTWPEVTGVAMAP
jgi:hypothetical protein